MPHADFRKAFGPSGAACTCACAALGHCEDFGALLASDITCMITCTTLQ